LPLLAAQWSSLCITSKAFALVQSVKFHPTLPPSLNESSTESEASASAVSFDIGEPEGTYMDEAEEEGEEVEVPENFKHLPWRQQQCRSVSHACCNGQATDA
jgi:hypothetical protein